MLASEYGWTIAEIEGLPGDVTDSLIHAILYRKGVKVLKTISNTPTGTLQARIDAILDTAAK